MIKPIALGSGHSQLYRVHVVFLDKKLYSTQVGTSWLLRNPSGNAGGNPAID